MSADADNLLDENSSAQQTRSSCVPVASVLQELRDVTSDQHRSLEQRLPFNAAGLDKSLYGRLIVAYYGFYRPLEQRLESVQALDPINTVERYKSPALNNDLLALGFDASQIAAIELCDDLPSVNNQSQLLGLMYVIEGATLGGQVLRRLARDKLAIDEHSGAQFLDVYGSATGRRWKEFLARLVLVIEPAERSQVTAAAQATFLCFERWLERSGVLQ